jgi:hypothetical protein
MNLVNLDETTRRHMRAEVERDVAGGMLYPSPRLSPTGRADYPRLLLAAVDGGTPESLAAELRRGSRLNTHEVSHRQGRPYTKVVPYTAADTLAEGEFNRFYIRGLCARAEAEGIPHVEVYRAKAVTNPRPQSTARIGVLMDPLDLLEDLRAHNTADAINTALGVPAGPNSGLSVRLVATGSSPGHGGEPDSSLGD